MDFRRFNPFEREKPETKSKIKPELLKFWTDNDLREHLLILKKVKEDISEAQRAISWLQKHQHAITDKTTKESFNKGKQTLKGLLANYPDIDDQIIIFEAEIESRKNN